MLLAYINCMSISFIAKYYTVKERDIFIGIFRKWISDPLKMVIDTFIMTKR